MNSPFRFVHTADLHLDSPLKSLARRDAHDSHNPSVSTVGFFLRQLNRLKGKGIRVYMIRGNHDHYSKLATTLPLPTLKEHGVVIHGVSFKEEHATESALRGFKAPNEKFKNIALLHTSLGGSEGHDVYAPCSIRELESMGFDYWALGHIHKRQVAGESCSIVMPGTPQGRDMGEDGAKTVSLVTLNALGQAKGQAKSQAKQFERITIHLTSDSVQNETPQQILNRFTASFNERVEGLKNKKNDIDRWIVRVICKADAATLYSLKIEIQFEDLGNTFEQTTTDHSLLKQLKQVVIEHLDDEHLMALTNSEFDDLIKFLPNKDTRDRLQGTREQRQHTIESLQKEGVEELLSMIQIDRVVDN